MTHPIPREALDDRHAFVGTAGSGKTYSAGTAVERVLSQKGRVVVIDPLGVWWGLRLTLDGETPSPFKVVIFGGSHGDLPINEHAGALIGETVAGMAESCIIDLSGIGTKAGERRFMLAFLTSLYRRTNGEPVHVVFDEADMFAPQRLLDKEGEAAKLLGMMETIVRRGRVKGFIPWLITQRPAVLSKDVLSQADGLIAFKLTSSQDRDAIGAWIEGQADKATGKEMLASLPGMQVGQGVVWIPGRGVLLTAQFPRKATYDSSRTPKRGETVRTASLKPIDLGALKERLSTVEAEAKANDPKALRAEIARLTKEAKNIPQNIPVPDPEAEARGYDRGFAEGSDKILRAVASLAGDLSQSIERAEEACAGAKRLLASFSGFTASQADELKRRPVARPTPQLIAKMYPVRQPLKSVNGHEFTGPQRRVLRSLAMWRDLGHETPSREMVAAASGYSPSSGGFNNLLGSLASAGAIGKPMPGHVSLLVGADDMSPEEGRDMLLGYLSNQQRKLVDALNGAGDMSRDALGERTGYSASSGGFNNLIGSLSTLGLITKPAPGYVALSPWAQELLQ